MSRNASRNFTGESIRTPSRSSSLFSSATAAAQGRVLSRPSAIAQPPDGASNKWQRLKKAVPGKASITNLVPEVLKQPEGGVGVAARRTIFAHARNIMKQRASAMAATGEAEKMLALRSVVTGTKYHGQQLDFVSALHQNVVEKQEERHRVEESQEAEGVESFDMSMSMSPGALRKSDLLADAIQQVERLRELAAEHKAEEFFQQTNSCIEGCVRMLDELKHIMDALTSDQELLRDVRKISECEKRTKMLLHDLLCEIGQMRDAVQAQAGSKVRSPRRKAQIEETTRIVLVFCDGTEKLAAHSSARVDEICMKRRLSLPDDVGSCTDLAEEQLEPVLETDAILSMPLDEWAAQPAQATAWSGNTPGSCQTGLGHSPTRKTGEESVRSTREVEQIHFHMDENAPDDGDDAAQGELKRSQTSTSFFSDADLSPGRSSSREAANRSTSSRSPSKLMGVPSSPDSQHLAPQADQIGQAEVGESELRSDRSDPGLLEELLPKDLDELRVSSDSSASPSRAKRAKKVVVQPKPVVKTKIQLLPPVKLPALSTLNRKNTDDLDWNIDHLNSEELMLLSAVIDEDDAPFNSLGSVSHDPEKERLWKSVFGLEGVSPSGTPRAPPLPQLLPKPGPQGDESVSPKSKKLAELVEHPRTPRSPRTPCRKDDAAVPRTICDTSHLAQAESPKRCGPSDGRGRCFRQSTYT